MTHKHSKNPQRFQTWRIKNSAALRRRGLAGRLMYVTSVHHTAGVRSCYVVGELGKQRTGCTLSFKHLLRQAWTQLVLA